MSDISNLIKEAKPLYLARKRQKQRFQKVCAAACCACCLFWLAGVDTPEPDLSFNIEEELYLTETGGAIEDLGLPTDDFGLLKVS